MGLLHAWMSTPDYSVGCLLFQILTSLTLWSWLIVTLAASDKVLNRSHAFLQYGSPASFWWYLVHFPVVMIIAYYLLPLHLNVFATFSLISGGSYAITLILTDLLLMRMRGALSLLSTLTLLKTRLHTSASSELSAQNVKFSTRSQPLERTVTGHLRTQPLLG
jgi:hypothetical protein